MPFQQDWRRNVLGVWLKGNSVAQIFRNSSLSFPLDLTSLIVSHDHVSVRGHWSDLYLQSCRERSDLHRSIWENQKIHSCLFSISCGWLCCETLYASAVEWIFFSPHLPTNPQPAGPCFLTVRVCAHSALLPCTSLFCCWEKGSIAATGMIPALRALGGWCNHFLNHFLEF